jgi:hypothetical protein
MTMTTTTNGLRALRYFFELRDETATRGDDESAPPPTNA